MRTLALLPVMLLFGCASNPPIEIKIPVAVPCIKEKPVAPIYPTAAESAGIFERVKVLLAERELRKGYEAKLTAMLAACGEIK